MSDLPNHDPSNIKHVHASGKYTIEIIALGLCLALFGMLCYTLGRGTSFSAGENALAFVLWLVSLLLWLCVVLVRNYFRSRVLYYVCVYVCGFVAVVQTLALMVSCWFMLGIPT